MTTARAVENSKEAYRPLTAKQKKVLDFISTYTTRYGYAPSLRDISSSLGTDNPSAAQHYVRELQEKGYVKREGRKVRGIRLTTPERSIPLLGVITAGEPIEAIENPASVTVPDEFRLKAHFQYYALTVSGDSMKDMGVFDGDTIIIQHQFTAESGDVVVAVTEQGATLKVLRRSGRKYVLEPRNKDYPTIRPETLEVRGKFVGLIRHAS